MPNVTSVERYMYYDIPHDDCRCSVVSMKYCLTAAQYKTGRVLPLLLSVSEIYLIREVLSLSGDHKYILFNILWMVSMFVFIGISVIIYLNNYYYNDMVLFLSFTGYLLFSFAVYEVGLDGYRNRPSRNHNITVNDQRSENTTG